MHTTYLFLVLWSWSSTANLGHLNSLGTRNAPSTDRSPEVKRQGTSIPTRNKTMMNTSTSDTTQTELYELGLLEDVAIL
jgi:hypothetical protein